MYMDVKEIVHILFKGYSVIFCNLRVFWGSRSVVENKKTKQTNNEFGLFISFNIIVFYVSMIYNKKEKYSEFIQYVTTQWNIVL